jgi:hypothetical protein
MRTSRMMVVLLLGALCAGGSPASAAQASAGASSESPLAVSAACTGQGDAAAIEVRIANRSNRDLSIVLGRLVGADRTQVVDSLFVMATRLATGAAEDFAFVNPKHAVLTGAAEPWIVNIPAGSTYSLDAPVRFFVSRLNYSFLEPLGLPGTRLLLDAKPNRAAGVWSGQIETPIQPCP